MKELRNLQYDLEDVTKERNQLRSSILEFQNFFNNVSNKVAESN
jgi:hypothetical protein